MGCHLSWKDPGHPLSQLETGLEVGEGKKEKEDKEPVFRRQGGSPKENDRDSESRDLYTIRLLGGSPDAVELRGRRQGNLLEEGASCLYSRGRHKHPLERQNIHTRGMDYGEVEVKSSGSEKEVGSRGQN